MSTQVKTKKDIHTGKTKHTESVSGTCTMQSYKVTVLLTLQRFNASTVSSTTATRAANQLSTAPMAYLTYGHTVHAHTGVFSSPILHFCSFPLHSSSFISVSIFHDNQLCLLRAGLPFSLHVKDVVL